MTSVAGSELPDHLFVAHARRDWAVAEWLTLKLVAAGYRLWCQRFPLIGDERYPTRIREAIAGRAFAVLLLCSPASAAIEDQVLNSTRELLEMRGPASVIGLDVEGIPTVPFEWMASTGAMIPFFDRWESGLTRLLAALDSLGAPRPLSDGDRVAAEVRRFMAARRSWHTVL